MEGVRTNAICMILHVLARPGCAHRVSAFCLRFPLAFLAAVTQPPRNEGGRRREKRGGGRREGVANRCKLLCGGRDTRWEIIFLGFSRRNSGISKKGGKESRGNLSRGGSFGVEGNYREKLALPSRTDDE